MSGSSTPPHAHGLSRSASFADVIHPAPEIKEEKGHSLGVKSIGTFLSFVFIINQVRRACTADEDALRTQVAQASHKRAAGNALPK